MQAISVKINQIIIKESPYLIQHGQNSDNLENSITKLGIIAPLIIQKKSDRYMLIDGFLRINIAKKLKLNEVPCVSVDITTEPTTLALLRFENHRGYFLQSSVNRVRAIQFLLDLGLVKEPIIARFFSLLDLEPNPIFFEQAMRIIQLPESVLKFCHMKLFSFKQLDQLTRYPETILHALVSIQDQLSISASVFLELAEHINDLCKIECQDPSHFFAIPEVILILQSHHMPQEKTRLLRNIIKQKRFPILTKTNAQLESIKKQLRLPKGIHLSWDSTLENKAIDLSMRITDTKQWQMIQNELANPKLTTTISTLLGIL